MIQQNNIGLFSQSRVLIIGDALLDIYILGKSTRFCREAPVPVFEIAEQQFYCGGAANTAMNVHALGGITDFISVTGIDHHSRTIQDLITEKEFHSFQLITDKQRKLPCKKRYLTDDTLVFRADEGSMHDPCLAVQKKFIDTIAQHWKTAAVIILADYQTGIMTDLVLGYIQKLQQKNPKKILVDARHPERYLNIHPYAVKPNYTESAAMLGITAAIGKNRIPQLLLHQQRLHNLTGSDIICQTLDKDGVILLENKKESRCFPAKATENVKSIGAGDTFTAAFALSIATGSTPEEACSLAHSAASIVLRKEKTAICSQQELKDALNDPPKYVPDWNNLLVEVKKMKADGKRIVFTNGCFDIVHKGHINLLKQAREFGDLLIVAVNNDDSIRLLKGTDRPVNSLEDRIAVLSALEQVYLITSFAEMDCSALIRLLEPDVFVKGSSSPLHDIPEIETVHEVGSELQIIQTSSHSTSEIIRRIRHQV